jgi:drug/metabolite transporter (DMT)-like permease
MGMERIGALDVSGVASGVQTAFHVITTPLVVLGLACYAMGAVFWLIVLSKLDLSLAYPILALNFVLVPFFGWLLLGEQVPSLRWIGVAIIFVGVTVISRT